MIASTLTNTAMSFSKMQVTLANIQSQLKLEKVSSLAKDTKIQSLKNLVLRMGYDPSNINVIEEIIKVNKTEVVTLKKQLKLSVSEDPMTKEIEEIETQKLDMMKLIMEHNLQIKQIEEKMKKFVKEKEEAIRKIQTSVDVVSLAEIPITKVSTLSTTSAIVK